ncbi:MAG: hypothetical protein AB7H71_19515 [Alphaproteobacteria bacterium]
MNGKIAAVLLSGLLVACVQTPPPAPPPPPGPPPAPEPASAPPPATAAPPVLAEAVREQRIVDIRGAGCEPLMALDREDQIAAAMFYIGYEASRFGSRTINVGKIPNIARLALAYCQAHPDRPVSEAFQQAYRYGRE